MNYYNYQNATDTGMEYSLLTMQAYTEAMKSVAAILNTVFASLSNIMK